MPAASAPILNPSKNKKKPMIDMMDDLMGS
jgi:hypothetical protein